ERRRVRNVLIAGAAIPAVVLVGIFAYTMVVLDRIAPSDPQADMTIEVTGKQYWWEVRYPSADVVTANEIHIPAGRRVRLLLESADVIHSLWVPRLHGKTDMIPGRTTEAWIMADEPGVYRGQCAEYCGAQHTWMALLVVAQPEEEFRAWLQAQARPAPGPARAPATARADRIRRGREVFFAEENRCASCHVIRGENDEPGRVAAGGTLAPAAAPGDPPDRTAEGPDLTHVASRRTLAAGLLPNTRGSMGGWVANPQVLKPGSLMPRVPLEPGDLNALLEYLMTLR
ncbi:MAG TPA: cytochrome c oxidase subunit II, partial [Longimicrobiales bacterium]|nr:cytochrome c oxidase subunit II [Longimicrobiales bacterium]